jgi:hypothetical protein
MQRTPGDFGYSKNSMHHRCEGDLLSGFSEGVVTSASSSVWSYKEKHIRLDYKTVLDDPDIRAIIRVLRMRKESGGSFTAK